MKKTLSSLFASLCLAWCATAAVPTAEKLLPDDTLLLLTIPDFSKALQIYHDSPQSRFWNDPAMKPFRDKFVDKLKSEFLTPLEHDLGVRFEDYTSLPQGQLTFAVVQDGWEGKSGEGKDPGLLLLLDTRDKSSQLKTNLTDLKKKWLDAGKPVKNEKIRDIEFSAIDLASVEVPKTLKSAATNATTTADADKKEAPKKAGKKQVYIGQADSLLVMCDSPRVIEKVLAAMSGGSVKTLGELPAYSANHNSLFREAPLYGWVNTKVLVDLLMRQNSGASDPDSPFPGPDKIVAALGLTGLKTIAFSYLYSGEGAQFNLMVGAPEDTRGGLLKILAGEPKDCNPPAFVPADVVKYQRWRIDGQKAWATFRKMIGDVSPQGLGGLDFMLNSAEAAAKEKNPDFDIKKDLFGNLGDDVISYQKNPKGDSLAALNAAPGIFMLGSPNPDKLGDALKTLLVLSPSQTAPTEREFLGHKINSVALPSVISLAGAGGPGPAGATTTLSYASSGGYLAFSTDAPILEEYLRSSESQGKSLRDTSGLGDATQKVGGPGTSLFGYSNDSETMRVFFEALKKESSAEGGMDSLAALSMLMGDFKLKDWLDVSLLPTFDKISKYFYFSVYSGAATPEGIHFKAYSPTPPQLKK